MFKKKIGKCKCGNKWNINKLEKKIETKNKENEGE
jgi:hypothetical protein